MIKDLKRLSPQSLEGFSGILERPHGGLLPFAVCLKSDALVAKHPKRKQALLELHALTGGDKLPTTYELPENISGEALSGIVTSALKSDDHQSVLLLCEDKGSFARTCETLGLSRRDMIGLAWQSSLPADKRDKNAYGNFHRFYDQVRQNDLRAVNFEDYSVDALEMFDPTAADYLRAVTEDMRRTFHMARKFVVTATSRKPKHIGSPGGRYYLPAPLAAIEFRGKMVLPDGTSQKENSLLIFARSGVWPDEPRAFDIYFYEFKDNKYILQPFIYSGLPNEDYNQAQFSLYPLFEPTVAKEEFDEACRPLLGPAADYILSVLETVNSPYAQHISHTPKGSIAEGTAIALTSAFNKGSTPFFASTEVVLSSDLQAVVPVFKSEGLTVGMRASPGLHLVKPFNRRYHTNDGTVIKHIAEHPRGNPERGTSNNVQHRTLDCQG